MRRHRVAPVGGRRIVGRRMVTLAAALLATGAVAAGAEAQDVDLSDIGHVIGDPDAPVTVVEFGDYACSACAEFHRLSWPQVKRELVDSGLVLWRHVPFLLGFRRGEDGAKAALCAADQGSFWAMHDRLFLAQGDWTGERRPKDTLVGYATELGLDPEVFRDCFEDNDPEDRIDDANDAADDLGIRVTPVFYIGGFQVQGALPAEAFIELARALADGRGSVR